MGQSRNVRIHDDTGVDAERVSEDDISGLSPDAVEVRQFLHRARYLAAVLFHECAAAILDALRLVVKKASRFDRLL